MERVEENGIHKIERCKRARSGHMNEIALYSLMEHPYWNKFELKSRIFKVYEKPYIRHCKVLVNLFTRLLS